TDIQFQPAPGAVGIAVGADGASNGVVYRSVDAGASWLPVSVGSLSPNGGCPGTYQPLAGLNAVSFASPAAVYAVGDSSTILVSTDAGATFADANTRPAPFFGCRVSQTASDVQFLPASPGTGYLIAAGGSV